MTRSRFRDGQIVGAPKRAEAGLAVPDCGRAVAKMRLPAEIAPQLQMALGLIERELGDLVQSVHLFGSAVMGGLKPFSDIDILVTVREPVKDSARQALMISLLDISAYPKAFRGQMQLRPLEVTVLAQSEIVPWRYPARRQLQFGEWLRGDLLSGRFESPMLDHDLAILLATVRQDSITLRGPDAASLLPAIPVGDVRRALLDTVAQWKVPADWAAEERGIVLALARIWFTAATGNITSKEEAAKWLLERLPVPWQSVLEVALGAYLGEANDTLADHPRELAEWIRYAKSSVQAILLSGSTTSVKMS